MIDIQTPTLINKLKILEEGHKMNEKNLNTLMRNIYRDKLNNIDNSVVINHLNELQKIVKFHLKTIQSNKRSYLTIVNLIFLPLGFIAGFFGMNFKSMGVPSLNKGILTIPHGEKFVFMISLLSMVGIIMYYYLLI